MTRAGDICHYKMTLRNSIQPMTTLKLKEIPRICATQQKTAWFRQFAVNSKSESINHKWKKRQQKKKATKQQKNHISFYPPGTPTTITKTQQQYRVARSQSFCLRAPFVIASHAIRLAKPCVTLHNIGVNGMNERRRKKKQCAENPHVDLSLSLSFAVSYEMVSCGPLLVTPLVLLFCVCAPMRSECVLCTASRSLTANLSNVLRCAICYSAMPSLAVAATTEMARKKWWELVIALSSEATTMHRNAIQSDATHR